MLLDLRAEDFESTEAMLNEGRHRMKLRSACDCGEPISSELKTTTVGRVDCTHVSVHADVAVEGDPSDHLYVLRLERGEVGFTAPEEIRAKAGDVLVGVRPNLPYRATVRGAHVHVGTLPLELFDEIPGPGSAAVRELRLGIARDPAAGEAWWRTYQWICEHLLTNPELGNNPLVVAHAERLLATVTLSTFGPDVPEPNPRDGRDSHNDTLRRSISFIEANVGRDISLADIASAAFVTPRAVQLAFSRHLNTTPMAYLRNVRLEFAHQELLAADSGRESVGGIARRWGFLNGGRFAAEYRETYGQSPQVTLRKGYEPA